MEDACHWIDVFYHGSCFIGREDFSAEYLDEPLFHEDLHDLTFEEVLWVALEA